MILEVVSMSCQAKLLRSSPDRSASQSARRPSSQAVSHPTSKPARQPASQPASQPSSQPATQPIHVNTNKNLQETNKTCKNTQKPLKKPINQSFWVLTPQAGGLGWGSSILGGAKTQNNWFFGFFNGFFVFFCFFLVLLVSSMVSWCFCTFYWFLEGFFGIWVDWLAGWLVGWLCQWCQDSKSLVWQAWQSFTRCVICFKTLNCFLFEGWGLVHLMVLNWATT